MLISRAMHSPLFPVNYIFYPNLLTTLSFNLLYLHRKEREVRAEQNVEGSDAARSAEKAPKGREKDVLVEPDEPVQEATELLLTSE